MIAARETRDHFCEERLPPKSRWPALPLDGFTYPERLNAAVELTTRQVEAGHGARIALVGQGRRRTYQELDAWTDQLACALVADYALAPGERVLIRAPNTPAMVAVWLAVTKAGGVAVNTMPMLRAGELIKIVRKARPRLALCDDRLLDELTACARETGPGLEIIGFDGSPNQDGALDRAALKHPPAFEPANTRADEVALLGFTSGTTGEPKATAHFHRDLMIIADGYAREVLQVGQDDVFVGSPPLAFTFGLGGLAVFPLRFGARAVLLEDASPTHLIDIIERHRATVCFTAPTAYRVMLKAMEGGADLSSLRCAVSAGETLPAAIYEDWIEATGKPLLDGIGATELLHIFITNRLDDHRPGCTGKPVAGYEAKILAEDGSDAAPGQVGKLAVRGPTGCRYLQDERQDAYVQDGWNITGDAFMQDEDGYFHFAARQDDMIVSAGYNIAGPEVEAALLAHPDVAECAVVGAADPDRGEIVEAHVVLRQGAVAGDLMTAGLQGFVKLAIAPYKYPRRIVFVDALPKTPTGKIQRFRLKPAPLQS
ncbi:MAG: AMP-binding protein [Oceanicaulis sp.]